VTKILAVVAVAFLAACSNGPDGPQLGAPCECPGGVGYPCELAGCGDGAACRAGTCAIACADGCPDGAVCVEDGAGGSCAFPCATASDCPDGLDRCDGTCYGGPLVTY